MNAFEERALWIACEGERMLGIVCTPTQPARDTGVVVVVGGPQVRAGSHRQFVQLARRLAADGYPVLRFDVRGMGDSEGSQRPFEALSADIAAAVDAFTSELPTLRRIVLWGLCDGASAALMYLQERPDPRIAGLCLANPWVRSAASLARTQVKHYYRDRLMQREFWAKLMRGGVAVAALRGLLANLRGARGGAARSAEAVRSYQDRMAEGLAGFSGHTLVLLSEHDYTAREFGEYCAASPRWTQLLAQASVERQDVAGADHTFSDHGAREAMESVTLRWLARRYDSVSASARLVGGSPPP